MATNSSAASFSAPQSKDGWTQVTNPSPSTHFGVHQASATEKMDSLKSSNPYSALHPDAEKAHEKTKEGPTAIERVDGKLQSKNPFATLSAEENKAEETE